MKKDNQLTCGFHLASNGVYGPCGKPAVYRIKKAYLCEECARYMQGRSRAKLHPIFVTETKPESSEKGAAAS